MKSKIESGPSPFSPMYGDQKLILDDNSPLSNPPTPPPSNNIPLSKTSRAYKMILGMAVFLMFAFIRFLNTPIESEYTIFPADQIPEYTFCDHPISDYVSGEVIIFQGFFLSRMLGSNPISDFNILADAWASKLDNELSTFSDPIRKYALAILVLMRRYQSYKVLDYKKPEMIKNFWKTITQNLKMETGLDLLKSYSLENIVSGKQRIYWD